MKIFIILFILFSFQHLDAIVVDEAYQFVTEGNITQVFEKGQSEAIKFETRSELERQMMTDPDLKFSFFSHYHVDVDQLFYLYLKEHKKEPIVFYEKDLRKLSKEIDPESENYPEDRVLINAGIQSKDFNSSLPKLTNGTFSLGPNQFLSSCATLLQEKIHIHPVCHFSFSDDEKKHFISYNEILKTELEAEIKKDDKNISTEDKNFFQMKASEAQDTITALSSGEKCSDKLEKINNKLEFSKLQENPFAKGTTFKDDSGNSIDCDIEKPNGSPCYVQRKSCISPDEEKIFKDPQAWLYPRNDDTWKIKLPVLDKENGKLKETTDYSYGKDFNTIESNNDIQYENSSILRESNDKRPELVIRKLPQYSINTKPGRYPLAEYPFFRPEDQCSFPVLNTQGSGGVCFQLACREHDYCFQSLPLDGKIETENLKKHFDECNSRLAMNILNLCSLAKTSLKAALCRIGAKIFYAGVENIAIADGGKDEMGKAFLKSQDEQARYLMEVYQIFISTHCSLKKNSLLISPECLKIKKILPNLEKITTTLEYMQ